MDVETKVFIILIFLLSTVTALILLSSGVYVDVGSAFGDATFQLISFITSTGYGANQFTSWPAMLLFLFVFAGYLGGCAGSTAGGNKIIRNILSVKAIGLEIRQLVHPHAILSIKYQGRWVDRSTLNAASSFMFVAATTTMVLTAILMFTGLDFWTSLTAVSACLNVLGPAFGELGNNFQPASDLGTVILSFAMILGRLEYFTVLALLEPAFWTR
jgi:trk system potassium uptake protein TrkH